jgi:hypothetical protein
MENNKINHLLSEIAHKHTPDSIREQVYRELEQEYGISHREAQEMADDKFGDYYG